MIDIYFPCLSSRLDQKISVHLDGMYWLNKQYERWFISGVHPQGTDSHCAVTPQEGEGWEQHNRTVEEAFPLLLAAIAAKKEELQAFVRKAKGIENPFAVKEAREEFGLSLKAAKELVEGLPLDGSRYKATKLPRSVFPLSSSKYPTQEEDYLCKVEGLWGDDPMPVSLLRQVEDLVDWQEELVADDFKPALVQLLSTGVIYGETDRLSLRFKINLEEETTHLYDWKLREPNSKSWAPDNKVLRVTNLVGAPALYAMYLAGKRDESESWKQRLGELINRK